MPSANIFENQGIVLINFDSTGGRIEPFCRLCPAELAGRLAALWMLWKIYRAFEVTLAFQ